MEREQGKEEGREAEGRGISRMEEERNEGTGEGGERSLRVIHHVKARGVP